MYHGSRGGLHGEIKPDSRPRCDFGSGFYMGTNPEQVKGLIVEHANPVIYSMKLHLSDIRKERILRLDKMDWVYTVIACRNRVKGFAQTALAKRCMEQLADCDVCIGPIADDRMIEAMRRFENYVLTDKGLEACLQSVDYGEQIVAKTETACKAIEILSENPLIGKELEEAVTYTQKKRFESHGVVERMQLQYQRDGKYLNELLEEINA